MARSSSAAVVALLAVRPGTTSRGRAARMWPETANVRRRRRGRGGAVRTTRRWSCAAGNGGTWRTAERHGRKRRDVAARRGNAAAGAEDLGGSECLKCCVGGCVAQLPQRVGVSEIALAACASNLYLGGFYFGWTRV